MATQMQPAQTYFKKEDYQVVKIYAKTNHQSVSDLLRESVLIRVKTNSHTQKKIQEQKTFFKNFTGIQVGKPISDLSLHHDQYRV